MQPGPQGLGRGALEQLWKQSKVSFMHWDNTQTHPQGLWGHSLCLSHVLQARWWLHRMREMVPPARISITSSQITGPRT